MCTLFTGQTSKEGFLMRYDYEFKKKCVKMYQKGQWPPTPDGINTKHFHDKVRTWSLLTESYGIEILKHKEISKKWTVDEKMEIVMQVINGAALRPTAIKAGISNGQLSNWVRKYKELGYNGLAKDNRGRPKKESIMKKKPIAKPLNESEREELIRLRAEVEYMRAENEVIKKEIALREEKQAALLKAKKQRSSKNSEKKDSN